MLEDGDASVQVLRNILRYHEGKVFFFEHVLSPEKYCFSIFSRGSERMYDAQQWVIWRLESCRHPSADKRGLESTIVKALTLVETNGLIIARSGEAFSSRSEVYYVDPGLRYEYRRWLC